MSPDHWPQIHSFSKWLFKKGAWNTSGPKKILIHVSQSLNICWYFGDNGKLFTHLKHVWKTFWDLKPVDTSRHFLPFWSCSLSTSLKNRTTCVIHVMMFCKAPCHIHCPMVHGPWSPQFHVYLHRLSNFHAIYHMNHGPWMLNWSLLI